MRFDLRLRPLVLAVAALLLAGGSETRREHEAASGRADDLAIRSPLTAALSRPPMRFEARGEHGFVGHARGAALALDERGATLALRSKDGQAAQLSMHVAHGRPVRPVASGELPTKVNRLIGRDESKWQRNVATYGRITYPAVLDGVDLVFHGEDGQLEYDFVVAPGADPSNVALEVEGGNGLSLTEAGDLAIQTGSGTLVQKRPRVYQVDAAGKTEEVSASYRLLGDQQVAFHVETYDRSRPLVIDPIMGYATFLGSPSTDQAHGIATGGANAYVVGMAYEVQLYETGQFANTGGPAAQLHHVGATSGPADAWVAKIDGAGRIVYLTFFGGSQDEIGTAVAVDENERVYVAGNTRSFDLKTTANAAQPELTVDPSVGTGSDAFLFALNADGSDVTYSTYVDVGTNDASGACSPVNVSPSCAFYYDDFATSLALGGGKVFVAGLTNRSSMNGDVVPNAPILAVDTSVSGAYVASLTVPLDGPSAAMGELLGTHFFGDTASYAPRVTVSSGLVYVGGTVCDPSAVQDTPNGFQRYHHGGCDGFVAGLEPGLTSEATWFTYLGGSGLDSIEGITSLPNGHVYVTGTRYPESSSPSCGDPVSCRAPAAINGEVTSYSDAFVAHFDASHNLAWLRLIGGSAFEEGLAIAVDPLGHVFMGGVTDSKDYPTTPYLPRPHQDWDGVVSEVSADGSTLLLSAYYGSSETYDRVTAVARSADGLHVAGFTFLQEGAPPPPWKAPFFPPVNATQPTPRGEQEAFVGKIQNTPLVLTPPESTVLPETEVGFVATGGVGFGYVFSFVTNGSQGSLEPVTGLYTAGGDLGADVIRVTDAVGNVATANVTVVTNQGSELVLSPPVTSASPKGMLRFNASGGTPPYAFVLTTNASNGTIAALTGEYRAGSRGSVTDRIRVTDARGQSRTALVSVTEEVTVTPPSATAPQNGHLTFTATGGRGAPYAWSTDQGTITTDGELTAPLANVVVKVTATDALGNVGTATVAVGSAIAITPVSPDTFPRGTVSFQAIGGAGGYVFAVVTDPPAGGTIGAGTGLYTAGANGGITETVDVKDSADRHATTTVTVGPAISITPASATLPGNTQLQLLAAGGSGAGYAFSIESSQSGASVDPVTGLYTAGPNGGEDVVKLVDSVGSAARATLIVTPVPSGGAGAGSSGGGSGNESSSGTSTVSVGSVAAGDGGCHVGPVEAPSTSRVALAGLGLGLLLVRRRRRAG